MTCLGATGHSSLGARIESNIDGRQSNRGREFEDRAIRASNVDEQYQ